MTMVYDLVGNLTSETDYRNQASTHSYDDGDRRTGTTNRAGDSMTFSYDNEGNVLTETDFAGRTTTYTYDRRYLKTSRTNALAGEYQWTYDARGNITRTSDELGRSTNNVYDRQNRLSTETDALGFETAYEYDANGNATQITDRRGNETTTEYDAINRPTAVTDPDGYTSRTTYDANGNRTAMQDGNGNTTRFTYDALNRVLTQTSPVGGVITHTYDANNNLATQTDAIGTVYAYEYDTLDRVTTEIHAQGNSGSNNSAERSQSFTYDANGNRLTQSNFRGHATNFTYDALDRLTQVTDALDQSSTTTYDAVGNKLTESDRRGNTTRYTYDKLNRVTQVTDALSQSIRMTYDAVGNALTETDKRGTATTHTHDDLNRLLSSSKPDGNGNTVQLVRNEYDGEGNITAVIDANDNRSETAYDGRGNQTQVTHPDESTVTYTYDGVGNLLTATDEINQITTFTYDAANRQVSARNFANETTTYAYDLNNNRTRVTKPLGNANNYEYDALNRLTQVTDGAGNSTTYGYDANDNQLSHTDANDNTVSYAFDELDRQTTHTQPNNLITTYSYDAEGNLTGRTDANGQSFSYTYDALNRQTAQNFPSVATPYMTLTSIETSFDANNNPTQIVETKTDNRSDTTVIDTTAMVYDLLDRETQNTQRGQSITYNYDLNGNRTGVSSAGGSTAYTYDSRNRLITATTGNGTSTYTYTRDSKQDNVAYANGTVTRYTYDAADRVTAVGNEQSDNTVISSFSYTYDNNGNRTQQVETQNGFSSQQSETTTYTFDNTDRMTGYTITQTNGDTRAVAYTYDANYNRIAETETTTLSGIETTTKDRESTFDANNRLSQITDNLDSSGDNTIDYIYDNNGNTLSKTDHTKAAIESTQFAYDSRNQLSQVIRGPPDSETRQGWYDYNYSGMRIRHLESERGDINYLYDGQAILEERDLSNNTLVAHYRYSDRLISLNTANDEQYYHYSALRTTANLTNNSGAIQASYRTDAWGTITQQEGSSPNRQVFTGHEHDTETGLIYMKARFYDPDVGRFLNQDSYLGESSTPPSLHRYLYAYQNPTVWVDPDGNFAVFGAIAGAGIDTIFQLGEIALTDKKLEEFSFTDVAVAAAGGALGVGLVNSARKLKKLGKLAEKSQKVKERAKLTVEVTGQIGLAAGLKAIQSVGNIAEKQLKAGQEVDVGLEDVKVNPVDVIVDVTIGRVTGSLGDKLGDKVGNLISKKSGLDQEITFANKRSERAAKLALSEKFSGAKRKVSEKGKRRRLNTAKIEDTKSKELSKVKRNIISQSSTISSGIGSKGLSYLKPAEEKKEDQKP